MTSKGDETDLNFGDKHATDTTTDATAKGNKRKSTAAVGGPAEKKKVDITPQTNHNTSTMNNSFVTYLPCKVERGISQQALVNAGLKHVDGKWVRHTDLTGMIADFNALDGHMRRLLPTDAVARHWMFNPISLPKTVEDTKRNTTVLQKLVTHGCKQKKFHNFFALLGHGRSNDGALIVLENHNNSAISPDDFAAWIMESSAEADKETVVCILVDSCYSGHWVNKFSGREWPVSVIVQSSCDHDEDAWGGAFTPIWMYLQSLSSEQIRCLIDEYHEWKTTLKEDVKLIEQTPFFHTNVAHPSTGPVASIHGANWITDPIFFQFICTRWNEQFLGSRSQIPNVDAEKLIENLVERRAKLNDFKLFSMKKPNECNMSALFECQDGTVYILHVHYAYETNAVSCVQIKNIISVFTTTHPVQDKDHADFSAPWNRGRWGNEPADIYKEERPRSTQPGHFLEHSGFLNPLDMLLRAFVASETGDADFFSTIANWDMKKGYNTKMRSRSYMAELYGLHKEVTVK